MIAVAQGSPGRVPRSGARVGWGEAGGVLGNYGCSSGRAGRLACSSAAQYSSEPAIHFRQGDAGVVAGLRMIMHRESALHRDRHVGLTMNILEPGTFPEARSETGTTWSRERVFGVLDGGTCSSGRPSSAWSAGRLDPLVRASLP